MSKIVFCDGDCAIIMLLQVVSVMVMFFTLKEIIFESQVIDPKIKTDIVVVSAVATIFTIVLIAGIIKVSVLLLKILIIHYLHEMKGSVYALL